VQNFQFFFNFPGLRLPIVGSIDLLMQSSDGNVDTFHIVDYKSAKCPSPKSYGAQTLITWISGANDSSFERVIRVSSRRTEF
jgi:ATP-dependent exoDNAse (exonuclease V) beta subunit